MKTRLGTWWMTAIMTSAALAASASQAAAQPPDGGPRGDRMAHVKQLRGRVLREKVGLDEARAQKVEAIFERYQPERRTLRKSVRDAMRTLRGLVDANIADDAQYAAAFGQLKATQEKLRELRDHQQAEVSRLLSPREEAKLLLTMKKARFEQHRHRFEGRFHRGEGGGRWQRGQGGGGPSPRDGFGPPPGDKPGPGPDGDDGGDDAPDDGPGDGL